MKIFQNMQKMAVEFILEQDYQDFVMDSINTI